MTRKNPADPSTMTSARVSGVVNISDQLRLEFVRADFCCTLNGACPPLQRSVSVVPARWIVEKANAAGGKVVKE